MDKLDLCRARELDGIFISRDAQLKVEAAKRAFDMQGNQILPVANYNKDSIQDYKIDVLALQAIENILQEAIVFIKTKVDEKI